MTDVKSLKESGSGLLHMKEKLDGDYTEILEDIWKVRTCGLEIFGGKKKRGTNIYYKNTRAGLFPFVLCNYILCSISCTIFLH